QLRLDSRAPAAEQLQAGLTIYLDYVAGHAHSWTALLRAGRPGTDAAATIAAEVDDHAFRLAIRAVQPGRRRSPEALAMAVRGWIALVKDSCLRWLEEGSIDRDSLQTLLTHAFAGCIQAATAADPACRPALERLSQPTTAQ